MTTRELGALDLALAAGLVIVAGVVSVVLQLGLGSCALQQGDGRTAGLVQQPMFVAVVQGKGQCLEAGLETFDQALGRSKHAPGVEQRVERNLMQTLRV